MAIRFWIVPARPVRFFEARCLPVSALHAHSRKIRLECGHSVEGDGYTNHCPRCLWSRHVDLWPGDRAANCRAPMRPVQLLYEAGRFALVHECVGCGERRRCRTSKDDDLSTFLR
jgi:hypothetical protein